MAKKFLLYHLNSGMGLIRAQDSYLRLMTGVLNRCLSQHPKAGTEGRAGSVEPRGNEDKKPHAPPKATLESGTYDPELVRDSSDDDDSRSWKWNLELAWLSKALEPALQLYKWASTAGSDVRQNVPPTTQSVAEIFAYLQRSKVGIQDWSLSDLTVGLYLIYLSQASSKKVEEVKGEEIISDVTVQELIYHVELAKGAYKDSVTALARHSMLRESNVLKFVKHSSVMRPAYYIGIDTRNKLVIFGIRGTHTVYDLITDMVSSSDKEVSWEGFSTHFGTAEAARWYLHHEIETIRKCLEKHKGFRLKLVGHSLGGAAAALLAIMIRKKSAEELGFNPEIVSAVGFGTPPCVSKELAENCSNYVSTVVLQDDIIPRLSTASLARLRNEILETDWMSVLEKEDWKGLVELVTNAKQVVSSVQDVARKLADYAKFKNIPDAPDSLRIKDLALSSKPLADCHEIRKLDGSMPEELYVPGTQYYLKRGRDDSKAGAKSKETYTLWKREPGEYFRRIVLSGSLISDHRCDSHYYALRDVLKGLPASYDTNF